MDYSENTAIGKNIDISLIMYKSKLNFWTSFCIGYVQGYQAVFNPWNFFLSEL